MIVTMEFNKDERPVVHRIVAASTLKTTELIDQNNGKKFSCLTKDFLNVCPKEIMHVNVEFMSLNYDKDKMTMLAITEGWE